MKKQTFFILLAIFTMTFAVSAQEKLTKPETAPPTTYKIDAKDVSSIDGIIKATYDVISGGVGEKRNWDRFHSLFYKDAKLIPSGTNRQGVTGARTFTPEEYAKNSGRFLVDQGFREREIARRTEIYGNIAHVFSTYEGFKGSETKPFLRGINSFQLLNDGKRWWVVNIFWLAETPGNPLPAKYLKSVK